MIRAATAEDADAVVAVFEPSFATLDFLPVLHTHEDNLRFFGSLVERADVFLYDDGPVRGFAALDGEMLSHLYVAPETFGRGVGSALFAEATRRRDAFTFWVFQANTRARRFYEARAAACRCVSPTAPRTRNGRRTCSTHGTTARPPAQVHGPAAPVRAEAAPPSGA